MQNYYVTTLGKFWNAKTERMETEEKVAWVQGDSEEEVRIEVERQGEPVIKIQQTTDKY